MLLERQYPSMVKFIEFCRKRSVDGVLPPPQYHAFGDWLSIKADTPKDVIYTAYYAHSTQLTARAAEVLGKAEDARTYNALFERIKAAFNKAFVAADGRIQGETQAVYVLALAFDLLDADQAKAAARHLLADIRSKNHHLSTGFIGTKDLMLVLSKIGATDVAYRLLHNTSFPSWGFSIEHGATSIWERWDGWTPEKGFQDPGMNSFAHYSFGAVYQWMVENIGGILADAPSYRSVTVAPVIDPKLTHAEVSYNSVRGLIVSRWSRSGDGTLNLDAIIPANTMGRVVIPAPAGATVEESGVPLAEVKGLRVVEAEGGKVTVKVGSGHYRFKVSPRN
ncbi:MAG: alpha-L-rhamnosidase C-terminal domain-containing protein [Isosphaeraceae bacterium]